MRTITSLLALLFIVGFIDSAEAQFLKKLGNAAERAAKRTVERRVERETEKKTDEALDEVFEAGKKDKNDQKQTGESNRDNPDAVNPNEGAPQGGAPNEQALTANVAKDYERGKKVIFHEQFDQVALGDFPGTWNTNIGGEVVTFGNDNTRWLKLSRGIFKPEGITTIPNNSTLEMDIRAIRNEGVQNGKALSIIFVSTNDKNKLYEFNKAETAVSISVAASYENSGDVKTQARTDGETTLVASEERTDKLSGNKNTVHLSVWRQDGRMRVYLDDEKVYDLPRAFADKNYNALMFSVNLNGIDYYLSNIILASEAGTDTRHKLLETGTFTTSDILFETAKATIQSSSFSILDEIAEVLTSNPAKHLTITGHTDSDGSDSDNQTLSEQRAESVKNYLVYKHNISSDQITTQGKGESEPVASGDSAEAKAKNRRVEFSLK